MRLKTILPLDLVLFEGVNTGLIQMAMILTTIVASQQNPPWRGRLPRRQICKMGYKLCHSLEMPYRKLSAEAIIGDYYHLIRARVAHVQQMGTFGDPLYVLKGIFDDLSIPDSQRTYANFIL